MPPRTLAHAHVHSVDPDLLDTTVQALNHAYVTRGLETAEALVAILVDRFWSGSIERALDQPDRHATFRALRARGDLLIAYPTLVRMLRVVGLRQRLLDAQRGARGLPDLSFSHWAELIRVKANGKVLPLARSARRASWSVRELRAAVAEANGEVVVPVGPLRSLHNGLRRSSRMADEALSQATQLLDDPEERAAAPEVLAELERVLARFTELRDLLATAVDSADTRPH